MLEILMLLMACCCMAVVGAGFVWFVMLRDSSTGDDGDSDKEENDSDGGDGGGEGGDWKTTGITFYGQSKADDNGIGFSGVDLFKHGDAKLTYKGKRVYPAAVFQGDGADYMYSVLEVKCKDFKKTDRIFVHVVDVCNSKQDVCINNTKKHGFLVDIHASAFDFLGTDDGLLKGTFKKVGRLSPNKIPQKAWDGEYIICSCKGSCRGDDVTWKKVGSC
jgi:hypothetical protein